MSRLRTFFLRESAECLATVRAELGSVSVDQTVLYRAIRRFRGSAQMARFGRLAEEAGALEERLRGGPEPSDEEALRRDVGAAVESLEKTVEAVRSGRLEEDPRMEAGMEAGTEQEAGAEGAAGADVVPVETVEYRGAAALDRALELREALETAIISDEPAGPILEELFDLVRLGAK